MLARRNRRDVPADGRHTGLRRRGVTEARLGDPAAGLAQRHWRRARIAKLDSRRTEPAGRRLVDGPVLSDERGRNESALYFIVTKDQRDGMAARGCGAG